MKAYNFSFVVLPCLAAIALAFASCDTPGTGEGPEDRSPVTEVETLSSTDSSAKSDAEEGEAGAEDTSGDGESGETGTENTAGDEESGETGTIIVLDTDDGGSGSECNTAEVTFGNDTWILSKMWSQETGYIDFSTADRVAVFQLYTSDSTFTHTVSPSAAEYGLFAFEGTCENSGMSMVELTPTDESLLYRDGFRYRYYVFAQYVYDETTGSTRAELCFNPDGTTSSNHYYYVR